MSPVLGAGGWCTNPPVKTYCWSSAWKLGTVTARGVFGGHGSPKAAGLKTGGNAKPGQNGSPGDGGTPKPEMLNSGGRPPPTPHG